MWRELLRRFLFVAEYLAWLVDLLFSAVVATHREALIDRRPRADRVGHAQRNAVPMEEILARVMKVILANHYPAIAAIFPHGTSLGLRLPFS